MSECEISTEIKIPDKIKSVYNASGQQIAINQK